MRNLVFKNLTSNNRRKRVISSSEIVDKQGMRTVIRRHFICKVIELKGASREKPLPQVYVCRICNHMKRHESFFYRIKGSIFAKTKGRLFLILFGHSLRIVSRPISEILS